MSNNKKKKQTTKTKTNTNSQPKQEQEVKAPVQEQAVQYRGVPKTVVLSMIKIGIPILACIIVVIVIVTLVNKKNQSVQQAFESSSEAQDTDYVYTEPLQQDAIEAVNTFANTYFQALAQGDTQTIQSMRDYIDSTDLIKYEKKSEFIESYQNLSCYTKPGITPDSYCLYVSYDIKFDGIDTLAPGLSALYLYTDESGKLVIAGDMDESTTAAMKLVTNQDDVVDLYNKVDVSFKEAVASDENLNTFLAELPEKINTAVGIALAQAEATTESQDDSQTDASEEELENLPVSTVVNEEVRATDTVNVRSSDSEEADKIGKAQAGSTLTRIEKKINGWSKVIFEGKEAYIKSDYLEVISSQEVTPVTDAIGTIKAKENVNVRKSPDITAEKLGVVQAGTSYSLLENNGEWYKISFQGKEGYVKAEFFE